MYLICYFFVLFLMRRRPPRSTLPSTLFPFTMLFRSDFNAPVEQIRDSASDYSRKRPHGRFACAWLSWRHIPSVFCAARESEPLQDLVKLCERMNLRFFDRRFHFESVPAINWHFQRRELQRSEECPVGKQCVSTCSSRCSLYHYIKKLYI